MPRQQMQTTMKWIAIALLTLLPLVACYSSRLEGQVLEKEYLPEYTKTVGQVAGHTGIVPIILSTEVHVEAQYSLHIASVRHSKRTLKICVARAVWEEATVGDAFYGDFYPHNETEIRVWACRS